MACGLPDLLASCSVCLPRSLLSNLYIEETGEERREEWRSELKQAARWVSLTDDPTRPKHAIIGRGHPWLAQFGLLTRSGSPATHTIRAIQILLCCAELS